MVMALFPNPDGFYTLTRAPRSTQPKLSTRKMFLEVKTASHIDHTTHQVLVGLLYTYSRVSYLFKYVTGYIPNVSTAMEMSSVLLCLYILVYINCFEIGESLSTDIGIFSAC